MHTRLAVGQLSSGVVENDAEGVTLAAEHGADTVLELDPVVSAPAGHGSAVDGDYGRLAPLQRHDPWAGLPTRELLYEHQFATVVVRARCAQHHDDLQRKRKLAVEVLV